MHFGESDFTSSNVHQHPAEVRGIERGGYVEGKSAIEIARKYGGRDRNFIDENFRACGRYVSTVGLDEAMVQAHSRAQETEDERYNQMKLVE